MARTTFAMLFVILLMGGVVLLQIFLSKKEGRIPGLVLPVTAFLFSLLYPLNMAAPAGGLTAGFFLQLLLVWLMGNIPTLILLTIYFACREKQRRHKQLDKMNIQDLE